MRKSFTLLELIVVMVIVAILAVISFPKFSTMREGSVEQEAIANLKLIQTAEKIYKMETGYYAPHFNEDPYYGISDNISKINEWLRLSIPAAGINWQYKIEAPPDTTFTGKARRITDPTKVRCIQEANDDPYTNGCAW